MKRNDTTTPSLPTAEPSEKLSLDLDDLRSLDEASLACVQGGVIGFPPCAAMNATSGPIGFPPA